jgi:signal transduction histidine kinase
VEVRDTGVGIAESELKWIFEPYYRGKASEPSNTGLGLGLAIVKELVELHDGKVWVETKLGKGSTFAFSLPLGNGKGAELGK